jgi:hypothetical protein
MDKNNYNTTSAVLPKEEEVRKLFCSFALEDPECLAEEEFYNLIEHYFESNQVENYKQLTQSFKNENYFFSRLTDNSIHMSFEDFKEVLNELCLVVKGGLDDEDVKLELNFGEEDLMDGL